MVDFFQIFVVSRNTEILFKLNYWLRMYTYHTPLRRCETHSQYVSLVPPSAPLKLCLLHSIMFHMLLSGGSIYFTSKLSTNFSGERFDRIKKEKAQQHTVAFLFSFCHSVPQKNGANHFSFISSALLILPVVYSVGNWPPLKPDIHHVNVGCAIRERVTERIN